MVIWWVLCFILNLGVCCFFWFWSFYWFLKGNFMCLFVFLCCLCDVYCCSLILVFFMLFFFILFFFILVMILFFFMSFYVGVDDFVGLIFIWVIFCIVIVVVFMVVLNVFLVNCFVIINYGFVEWDEVIICGLFIEGWEELFDVKVIVDGMLFSFWCFVDWGVEIDVDMVYVVGFVWIWYCKYVDVIEWMSDIFVVDLEYIIVRCVLIWLLVRMW